MTSFKDVKAQLETLERQFGTLIDPQIKGTCVDFTAVIKFAIDTLAVVKKKAPPLARLGQCVAAFASYLRARSADGTIKRVLCLAQLRTRLECINRDLYLESYSLLEYAGKTGDLKKLGLQPKLEPSTADKFWRDSFGFQLMVPWSAFVQAFQQVSTANPHYLKYVMDFADTGYATVYRFREFLLGFQPFDKCGAILAKVCESAWFQGFISAEEAQRLLAGSKPGTYIIRFSKCQCSRFAIAYCLQSRIVHSLIDSGPDGFSVDDKAKGKPIKFKSIFSMLEHFAQLLQTPYRAGMMKDDTFYGDVAPQEAAHLLEGKQNGAYLFRFSSQPGSVAVSYLNSEGRVIHGLIQRTQRGFFFENKGQFFRELNSLARFYSDIFAVPVKRTTFVSAQKAGRTNSSPAAVRRPGGQADRLRSSAEANRRNSTAVNSLPGGSKSTTNYGSVPGATGVPGSGADYGSMTVEPVSTSNYGAIQSSPQDGGAPAAGTSGSDYGAITAQPLAAAGGGGGTSDYGSITTGGVGGGGATSNYGAIATGAPTDSDYGAISAGGAGGGGGGGGESNYGAIASPGSDSNYGAIGGAPPPEAQQAYSSIPGAPGGGGLAASGELKKGALSEDALNIAIVPDANIPDEDDDVDHYSGIPKEKTASSSNFAASLPDSAPAPAPTAAPTPTPAAVSPSPAADAITQASPRGTVGPPAKEKKKKKGCVLV